jgi:GDP-L-fucose synthase
VQAFFEGHAPEYVFLAAARVGGIAANMKYPADFIRDNLLIQTNVMDAAYRAGVKKILFLGSSCIYPKNAAQPITEESLLTGALEPTNKPYAVAKIAGAIMAEAYGTQFDQDIVTVMPSNVYGIGDNFHPENSHLVAGMMRRFHEAKVAEEPETVVWGDGTPMRELIFSEDLADACLFLMKGKSTGLINVGSAKEITVAGLASLIKETVGFEGDIVFDTSKPNGVKRKIMDNSRLQALGWQAPTDLRGGMTQMYRWYLQSIDG